MALWQPPSGREQDGEDGDRTGQWGQDFPVSVVRREGIMATLSASVIILKAPHSFILSFQFIPDQTWMPLPAWLGRLDGHGICTHLKEGQAEGRRAEERFQTILWEKKVKTVAHILSGVWEATWRALPVFNQAGGGGREKACLRKEGKKEERQRRRQK